MRKMETIMPKAKSAIKVIAIVLLMCFHEGAQSQNKAIDGLFCRVYFPSGDFSNCLEFNKNNTFEYEFSDDLGTQSYAQGQYELIKNKLILDYNKTVPLKMSYHVSEIWQSNKDSITVNFNFFDFNGNPAIGVDVFYRDSLSPKGYITNVSDANGRVYFNLKKDIKELQFEISSMDYGLSVSILHSFYNVTIYKEWNYKISVYLQKSYTGIPILNQKDTLNLVKIKRKYFTVRNKNGSVTTWRKIED